MAADRFAPEAPPADLDRRETAERLERARLSGRADLPMLFSLAHARAELGQWAQALGVLRSIIATAPGLGDALHLYGVISCEENRFEQALAVARRAVAVEPSNLGWLCVLGATLSDLGFSVRALPVLRKVVAIEPYAEEGLLTFANALSRARRYDESSTWHERNLTRRAAAAPGGNEPVPCNSLRLRHDIEQMTHLKVRGIAPANADAVVALYRDLLARAERDGIGNRNFDVVPAQLGPAGAAFGRIVRRVPPRRIAPAALSRTWNRDETTRRFAVPPGICWIDDFLTQDALSALRRFCLESTIWQDVSHNLQDQATPRGYLGTYPNTGFTAPLLYQIAEELAQALPDVFADHALRQMWSYKYEAHLEGIDLHGDDAAVNVNFWLTPDEANLDQAVGGLMVHPVEAPADWQFAAINRDPDRIRRFLADSGVAPVNVPYRQNRAVIFNSDLFHATAPIRFRTGYENRRINVTMLFGRRPG